MYGVMSLCNGSNTKWSSWLNKTIQRANTSLYEKHNISALISEAMGSQTENKKTQR